MVLILRGICCRYLFLHIVGVCLCTGQIEFNMLLHCGRAERLREWEKAEEGGHREQLS